MFLVWGLNPAIFGAVIGKEIRIVLSPEVRKRVEYHSKRLSCDMTDIVRTGMLNYLELLDEKEFKQHQIRNAIDGKNIISFKAPRTKSITQFDANGKPLLKSLRKKRSNFENALALTKPHFRRWADYIEGAVDRSDAADRTDTVLKDLKDKVSTPREADEVFATFQQFLSERKEMLRKKPPPKPSSSPVKPVLARDFEKYGDEENEDEPHVERVEFDGKATERLIEKTEKSALKEAAETLENFFKPPKLVDRH